MIFTQYMRPSGAPKEAVIDRPEDVEALATELREHGWSFEIEVLRTGEVSMDCCDEDAQLESQIVPNGPAVPVAVDTLVRDSHRIWVERGRPRALGRRRDAHVNCGG